jgi:hypothetical protein
MSHSRPTPSELELRTDQGAIRRKSRGITSIFIRPYCIGHGGRGISVDQPEEHGGVQSDQPLFSSRTPRWRWPPSELSTGRRGCLNEHWLNSDGPGACSCLLQRALQEFAECFPVIN